MITLIAFRSVPPFAQGLVRDVRVRWALEEAGIPYQERLIGPEDQNTAAYRAIHVSRTEKPTLYREWDVGLKLFVIRIIPRLDGHRGGGHGVFGKALAHFLRALA